MQRRQNFPPTRCFVSSKPTTRMLARSRDNQRDLVEQAFRLAASAKFPIRMHGVAGSLVDTRSGCSAMRTI